MTDRLSAQFAFLMEADRLKQVLRATTLADGSRYENSGDIPGTLRFMRWCWQIRPRRASTSTG